MTTPSSDSSPAPAPSSEAPATNDDHILFPPEDNTPAPDAAPASAPAADEPASDDQPAPASPKPAEAPAPFNPQAIADAVRSGMEAANQKAAPSKQLTQEEIDQYLGNFKVTDKDMERLFAADMPNGERAAVFKEFLDKAVSNAVTRTQILMMHEMQQFEQQRFAPIEQYYRTQSMQAQRDAFYKEFPGLKEFPEIVSACARSVQEGLKQGEKLSNDEYKDRIVKAASLVIGRMKKDFDPKKVVDDKGAPAPSAVPKATPKPNVPAPAARGGSAPSSEGFSLVE